MASKDFEIGNLNIKLESMAKMTQFNEQQVAQLRQLIAKKDMVLAQKSQKTEIGKM